MFRDDISIRNSFLGIISGLIVTLIAALINTITNNELPEAKDQTIVLEVAALILLGLIGFIISLTIQKYITILKFICAFISIVTLVIYSYLKWGWGNRESSQFLFFCFLVTLSIAYYLIFYLKNREATLSIDSSIGKNYIRGLLITVVISHFFVIHSFYSHLNSMSSRQFENQIKKIREENNHQFKLTRIYNSKIKSLNNELDALAQDTSELRPERDYFIALYRECDSLSILPPGIKNSQKFVINDKKGISKSGIGDSPKGYLHIFPRDINNLGFTSSNGTVINSIPDLTNRLGSGTLLVTLTRGYSVLSATTSTQTNNNFCRAGSTIRIIGPVTGPNTEGTYKIQYTLIR